MTTEREEFELKISMEYEQPPCIDRDGDGYADSYVDNAWWGWQKCKAECEKEIAELHSELKSADDLRERMSKILTDTANALKGEPDELTLHSWHDLAEKAMELKASNNSLREAFRKIRSCYGDGYEVDNIARQALSSTPAQCTTTLSTSVPRILAR